MSDYTEIITYLNSLSNPENVRGMARFGINPKNTIGIPIPVLRNLAKSFKKRHDLALELWKSGIHEVKILASMIDDPVLLDEKQMEEWVLNFDSWDVCDQVCMNLFGKSPLAWKKAAEWHSRKEEFVKRAGFALMAVLAFTNKKAADESFYPFFDNILKESDDDRAMVKKAVNWALRQIGKRNSNLNKMAVEYCYKIKGKESKPSTWIASDALRELTSEKITERIRKK